MIRPPRSLVMSPATTRRPSLTIRPLLVTSSAVSLPLTITPLLLLVRSSSTTRRWSLEQILAYSRASQDLSVIATLQLRSKPRRGLTLQEIFARSRSNSCSRGIVHRLLCVADSPEFVERRGEFEEVPWICTSA